MCRPLPVEEKLGVSRMNITVRALRTLMILTVLVQTLWGSPQPSHGPGPHVSTPGPSVTALVDTAALPVSSSPQTYPAWPWAPLALACSQWGAWCPGLGLPQCFPAAGEWDGPSLPDTGKCSRSQPPGRHQLMQHPHNESYCSAIILLWCSYWV